MQVTAKARVGFAGPAVILNTVYGMDQGAYDANCPQGFQSAAWLQASPHAILHSHQRSFM
jgi:hypothetical protein